MNPHASTLTVDSPLEGDSLEAVPDFVQVVFPSVLEEPMDPAWDLGVSAQYIVLTHFREMLSHRQGVWVNREVEAVHQIRVAARRCRTALQTLGTLWDAKQIGKFSCYLAAFAESFNVARDLDVLLLWLDEQLVTASAERAAAYRWLRERNGAKRAAEQSKLKKSLRRLEDSGFHLAFVAYFSRLPSDLWAIEPALPIEDSTDG